MGTMLCEELMQVGDTSSQWAVRMHPPAGRHEEDAVPGLDARLRQCAVQ